MSDVIRILISGATGYIGGSVLNEILKSNASTKYQISALIRDTKQAQLLEEAGVKPIIFEGLDDLEACRKAAAEHDADTLFLAPVVISAASASHFNSAKAWILGLSERQKVTGKRTFYIHTSGTSILGDRRITGKYIDTKIHSDMKENIHEFEKNHAEEYGHRKTDLMVIESGKAAGVLTYIIVPPTIYGRGTGLFSKMSQQIPNLIRLALKKGHAVVIGDGNGIWNHVHISDLSVLYALLLSAAVNSKPTVPHGERGIYFAESGEHTWRSISESIAKVLKSQGAIDSDEVEFISLAEAANGIPNGTEKQVELSLASNSRSKADLARELLGWKPVHGDASYNEHFADEAAVVMGRRSNGG